MISLYIKTHRITGLKYFGKTQQRDVSRYKGSGKRWLRHLAKHGNDVDTFVVATYQDEQIDEAVKFAVEFSAVNDIVKDPQWANLIVENILGGPVFGSELNDPYGVTREAISNASKAMWKDPFRRAKIVDSHKKRWTPERKAANAESMRHRWTTERREKHSRVIKQYQIEGRLKSGFGNDAKSDEHKRNISKALTGKPKSLETIMKLKWQKMGGATGFTGYAEYAKYCHDQRALGVPVSAIRLATDTGNTAVYNALKFWPHLATYLAGQ